MSYRKLSLEKAREIRRKKREVPKIFQRDLAKEFGCSQVNIGLVLKNKIYREEKKL